MEGQNFYQLNCTEDALGPRRGPLYTVIPVIVIYVIIFITGVIGNVSACIVISRNKSMHTATNYYLFNLAVSDLLLLVSGLPQEIYLIWSRYPYIFGDAFCFLHGLFGEISANATVCTITAFTVERYLAICHPLRSHTMSKLTRAVKIMLCIWFFSICLALPQAMQFKVIKNGDCEICYFVGPVIEHSFEVSTMVFFVAPMTLITVLYILIGLKLKSSNMMKRRNVKVGSRGKSSKKVVKMLVAVVVAFFICWAPYHIQRLFAMHAAEFLNKETHSLYLKIYEVVTYISGILYYISATINPILYNIMSVKFREAFKETFFRCCCLPCFKSRGPERAYSVLSRTAPAGRGGRESTTDSGKENDNSSQTHTTLSHKDSAPDQLVGKRSNPAVVMNGRMSSSDSSSYPTAQCPTCQSDTECNYEMNIKNIDLIKVRVKTADSSTFGNSQSSCCCQIFHCMNKEKLQHRRKYSAYFMPNYLEANIFHVSRKNNIESPCHISNTSLRDVEKGALEDELTSYMREIRKREETRN